jgi:chromosome segregation ATPase
MKIRNAAIAMLTALALTQSGIAQTAKTAKKPSIADLASQLNAAVADKGAALNTIQTITENAAPVQKELKLWDGEIVKLQKDVEFRDARLAAHNADAAVVNDKVNAHNGRCSGTLPKPQYEKCRGEEPYLQSQINRIAESKRDIDQFAAELKRRGDPILARYGELGARMDRYEMDLDAAEARLKDAQARIESLTARLRAACKDETSREGMAYCGQVDWDGARPGLGTLPANPKPTWSARPN